MDLNVIRKKQMSKFFKQNQQLNHGQFVRLLKQNFDNQQYLPVKKLLLSNKVSKDLVVCCKKSLDCFETVSDILARLDCVRNQVAHLDDFCKMFIYFFIADGQRFKNPQIASIMVKKTKFIRKSVRKFIKDIFWNVPASFSGILSKTVFDSESNKLVEDHKTQALNLDTFEKNIRCTPRNKRLRKNRKNLSLAMRNT